MNEKELKIRYQNRVRFWYKKFIELSDITDKLHNTLERQKIEIERQRKLVEKVVCQNCEVMQELQQLKQEKEEMSFSDVTLEK
jgi:hypothetical protein